MDEKQNRCGFKEATIDEQLDKASRPDVPPQNFQNIPQEWALAYIEERAAEEEANG